MLPPRHAKGSFHRRLLLLSLAGILALIAAPASAAAKPGPHLKVRSVEIENPDPSEPLHMFHQTSDSLQAHVRVKNVGHGPGRGRGVLKIQGSGQLSPTKLKFSIPRLKPGRAKVIDLQITSFDAGRHQRLRDEACVGNNCHAGPRFAVIPRKWKGMTHSVVDDNGIVSTCDGHPTFTYNHPASGNDRFIYRAAGLVTCTASGSQGGCTYSGGGEEISIEEFLTVLSISSSLDSYNASAASTGPTRRSRNACPIRRRREPRRGGLAHHRRLQHGLSGHDAQRQPAPPGGHLELEPDRRIGSRSAYALSMQSGSFAESPGSQVFAEDAQVLPAILVAAASER